VDAGRGLLTVVAILLADTFEVGIVDARHGLLMRCLLVVRLVTTTVVAVLLTDTSEAGIVDAVQGFLTASLLIIEFATTPVIAALFAHRLERVEAIKVGRGLQAERFPTLGVVITPVGVASLFDTPIQQLVSMPPALDEETSVGASMTEMLLLLLSDRSWRWYSNVSSSVGSTSTLTNEVSGFIDGSSLIDGSALTLSDVESPIPTFLLIFIVYCESDISTLTLLEPLESRAISSFNSF